MPAALVGWPGRKVARVAVDNSLPHLDRLFDYAIPDSLAETCVVGCRVKVRFAGLLRDGWVCEIAESSAFDGELDRLHKVVSPEPVLTPSTDRLVRAVADHYAGNWWSVARLAIPPRHSTTEKANQREWPDPAQPESKGVLASYPTGAGYVEALALGRSPRAAWQAVPVAGEFDVVEGIIEAAAATLRSGRGVVVVVPTIRDLDRVLPRFHAAFGAQSVATLAAEHGRSPRYRNYLALTRGLARVVVGTRSAVFAPVRDAGLIAVLDEGSDHHVEQRAPYFHARTVAILRASLEGAGLLFASHSRSVDSHALIARDWMHEIRHTPSELRRQSAPVRTISEQDRERDPTAARLRIPSRAFAFLRAQLPQGPVLVQVPMGGFAAALACERCRNLARCPRCESMMRARRRDQPECAMCGHRPVRWECRECHGTKLRMPLPGADRTAEELARAFPGVLAINSSGERIRDEAPNEPGIVVATPGAEPRVDGGYAGLLILDADVTLSRADVAAPEEAMRRWMHALALVRPPTEGGSALIVGAELHPAVQALARTDAVGLAERELADRTAARLPPTVRTARVTGEAEPLQAFLRNVSFDAELLGPTEIGAERWAALLRTDLARGRDFVAQVKSAAAIRSAKKQGGVLNYQIDPEVTL
ncbi:MAG: hypothetical protein GX596_06755 [Propionibacterium sp.]|nr:hypothetical protein [Propionibacterium sp.]